MFGLKIMTQRKFDGLQDETIKKIAERYFCLGWQMAKIDDYNRSWGEWGQQKSFIDKQLDAILEKNWIEEK